MTAPCVTPSRPEAPCRRRSGAAPRGGRPARRRPGPVLRCLLAAGALLGAAVLPPSGSPARAALPGEQRGRGAGELQLDAASVLAIVDAALPDHLRLDLPGAGSARLEIAPPSAVRFIDGGVEAVLHLALPVVGWRSAVRVRYAPDVRPEDGVVRLAAEAVEPDVWLPVAVDLAPLLPAADLPRSLDWSLDGPGGRAVPLRFLVQGLRIDDERLVIEFGMSTRPVP